MEHFPIGRYHRTARKSRQDKPRRASDRDPKIGAQKLPVAATRHGICRLNLRPSPTCRSYRQPAGCLNQARHSLQLSSAMLAVINFHRHSARHREASAQHFTFWVLRDELSVIDIFPCGSIGRLLRSGTPAPFERECLKFVQPGALTEREKSPPLCPIMQADQKLSRGP